MSAQRVDILVVDDRPESLLALKGILQSPELNVVAASSGEEALAKMLEHRFACILLDVQMPDFGGLDVAKILQEDPVYRQVPILFMTAHRSETEAIRVGYDFGAVDYLFKPLDAAVVRAKVRVFAELLRREIVNEQLVNELRSVNDQLHQVSKVMAHDLKEPLRILATFSQRLARSVLGAPETPGAAPMVEAAELVRSHAIRVCEIMDGFVSFLGVAGRSKTSERIHVDKMVGELLQEMEPVIVEKKATMSVASLPDVIGRYGELRFVFRQVLSNALRFSGERAPEVRVSSYQARDSCVFVVSDNGQGIKERDTRRIFELFWRSGARESSQLPTGLAMCRRIVEHHQGRIWVDSVPGKGSTFFIALPAGADAPA